LITYNDYLVEKFMSWSLKPNPESWANQDKISDPPIGWWCCSCIKWDRRAETTFAYRSCGRKRWKQRRTETIARGREMGRRGTAFVENDSFSIVFAAITSHVYIYNIYIILYDVHCAPTLTMVTSAIRSLLFDSPLSLSLRSRGRPILL